LSLFFGGMSLSASSPGDELDERAGLAFSGENRRIAGVAALDRRVARIETVAALLLLRPVAADAVLLQNRPHIARKVHRARSRRRQFRTRAARACERRENQRSQNGCGPVSHGGEGTFGRRWLFGEMMRVSFPRIRRRAQTRLRTASRNLNREGREGETFQTAMPGTSRIAFARG
jgi:hypothetical protein